MSDLVSLYNTQSANITEIENLKKQVKDSNKENMFAIYKKIDELNKKNDEITKKIESLTSKKVEKQPASTSITSSTAIAVIQKPSNTVAQQPSENENALQKIQEAISIHTKLTKTKSAHEQESYFDAISQISNQITNSYKDKIKKNNGVPDITTKEFLKNLSALAEKNKNVAEGRVWDMCNSIYESITESYNYLDVAQKQIPGLKNMLCQDEEIMKNGLIEVQELFQESVSHTPGDEENNSHTAIFNNYNPKGTSYCILTESPRGIKIHQFVVSGNQNERLLVKQLSKKPHTIPYEKMDDLKKILKDHTVLFAGEKPSENDPFKD